MPCTTSPRCRISPSQALVQPRLTVRAVKNGNLATAVSAWRSSRLMATLWSFSHAERDGERFQGAVVGLGGLGVVTKLTLDIQPAFDVRQVVYENLPLATIERATLTRSFRAATASACSPIGKTIGPLRSGSRAASTSAARPRSSLNSLAQSSQPKTPSAGRAFGGELHRADGHSRPLV